MSAKVNWKDALREFVSSVCKGKDDSTWAKPNRRWLQHDVYMPSTISETMGRLVVAVDTSGSITGDAINRFLSEVVGIMNNVNPELVDLLYWDSEVAGHEVYGQGDGDKLMSSTKPKGGGGTDVNAVFDYVKEKIPNSLEACIILTDGYTPYPSTPPSYPVLWVMTTDVVAPFGQIIRIGD